MVPDQAFFTSSTHLSAFPLTHFLQLKLNLINSFNSNGRVPFIPSFMAKSVLQDNFGQVNSTDRSTRNEKRPSDRHFEAKVGFFL